MSDFDIILDNSQQNLREVPSRILTMYNLKMLYLQGNFIERLPDDFFTKLHQLTWLDLRDNRLTSIPQSIAYHEHLENLLLTNNRLEVLPTELGLVPTLRVLQIAENPILYPPRKILVKGTKALCAYLKDEYEQFNPQPQQTLNTNQHELTDYEEEKIMNEEEEICLVDNFSEFPLNSQSSEILVVKGLSEKQQGDNKIIHKMTKDASKISLKSYYNSSKYIKASTQTSDHSVLVRAAIQQEWVDKLKNLLIEQERILQQEKNLKALDEWREKTKKEPIRQVDYHEPPPYATDIENLGKEVDTPPNITNKDNIERMINDLVGQLKDIEENYKEMRNPKEEIIEAGNQIRTIVDLHKKLLRLQANNDLVLK